MKLTSHEVSFIFVERGCIYNLENKVKEKRLELNMTQVELAFEAKVSSRTIISIEKEQYNPSLLLAYKLSKILNVSIDELFNLEKELLEEENENKK